MVVEKILYIIVLFICLYSINNACLGRYVYLIQFPLKYLQHLKKLMPLEYIDIFIIFFDIYKEYLWSRF